MSAEDLVHGVVPSNVLAYQQGLFTPKIQPCGMNAARLLKRWLVLSHASQSVQNMLHVHFSSERFHGWCSRD